MVHLERNFKNVIQLAVAFNFICFGLYGHQYIFKEAIITMWKEDGDTKSRDSASDVANTIYYVAYGFSSLIVPAIIGFVGAKVATLSGTTFIFLHIFTMILFQPWLCFLTSGFQGLGFALLWGSQGKLLKMNSTTRTADKYTNTFFGIAYSSTLFTAIFLMSIFFITGRSDGYSIKTLIITYSIMSVSIVGGFITLFFMKMPSKNELTSSTMTIEKGTIATNTYIEILLNVFKVLFKRKIIKFIIIFLHFGMSCAVWSSLIPNTISASEQFGKYRFYHMAGCCFIQGIAQLLGSFLLLFYGPKLKKLTRIRKAYLGGIFTFLAYLTIFLTIPPQANQGRTTGDAHIQINSPYFTYISSFFVGLGDIIYKIQVTTHILDIYPDQSAEAFSLLFGFQGAGQAATFALCIYLTLDFIMILLMIYLLISLGSFYYAERKLLLFYKIDDYTEPITKLVDNSALGRYMTEHPDGSISKGIHKEKYISSDLMPMANNNTLNEITE
uniref:UNC93-like protein MFSD11 n=1 Tax=Parastrongyloides trichosuri TaxID=131310 RepID=A0A0N4ZI94_PARTI